MDIGDFIWVFVIIAVMQPMIRKKLLEVMRQRKIAEIEGDRKSRVILLVHRQETMSFLGFPVMRYIDIHDSEEVLRAIQMTDENLPLDIILHTPGGLALAATQIARAIKAHPGKVTVFVPHIAMSGGTLIALAADEIVMCRHSVLGSIDPQIGQQPAVSLIKVTEQKPIAEIDDATLVLADMGKKAIIQIRETAEELLAGTMKADKAARIARTLSEGRWTHDYPISADKAQEVGLNITTDMPKAVLEMMALYPQPTKNVPSVEYLPQPHRRGPDA